MLECDTFSIDMRFYLLAGLVSSEAEFSNGNLH